MLKLSNPRISDGISEAIFVALTEYLISKELNHLVKKMDDKTLKPVSDAVEKVLIGAGIIEP